MRIVIFYYYMKKNDFAEELMKKTGIASKKEAVAMVDAFLEVVVEAMGRGDDVAFTGFGTFRVAKRAARMGINPKTGEKIQIKASIKPKFRAGKILKEAAMKVK